MLGILLLPLTPLLWRMVVEWPRTAMLALCGVLLPLALAWEGVDRIRQARAALLPGVAARATVRTTTRTTGLVMRREHEHHWLLFGGTPPWSVEIGSDDADPLAAEVDVIVHSPMRARSAAAIELDGRLVWPKGSLRRKSLG